MSTEAFELTEPELTAEDLPIAEDPQFGHAPSHRLSAVIGRGEGYGARRLPLRVGVVSGY